MRSTLTDASAPLATSNHSISLMAALQPLRDYANASDNSFMSIKTEAGKLAEAVICLPDLSAENPFDRA